VADEASSDTTAVQAAAKKAAETEAAKQAMEADAAKKVAEDEATKKVDEAEAAKKATEVEKATASKGSEAESPDVATSVLKEQVAPKGSWVPKGSGATSTTSHKEQRTKKAGDPARMDDTLTPEVDTASTDAAMHAPRPEEGEELHTAN
jgi:hypothetical protein